MLRPLLGLLLLSAVTVSSAQNPGGGDYSLSVDVELVQVPVSVLDKHGFPVRGLQPEHFEVYEDKVRQDLTLFKQEDIPLSVALVIDASGSITNKLDRLNAGAVTFVKESHPQDETALVSFGEEIILEQDFTNDAAQLSRAISAIALTNRTVFFDAIDLAIKHLERHGSHEKKVLIVLSDGEDNSSRTDFKQVRRALAESKITLYAIGLLNWGQSSYYGLPGQPGKKFLKELAEVSGGAAFFPKKIDEVEDLCERIAHDLRNQYTIGYRPSNRATDGSWRKIVIKLKPPPKTPKYQVRAKQGYYAPRISEARRRSDDFIQPADMRIRNAR